MQSLLFMNITAFHALVRSLEFAPDAASAATALVDALTARGSRAVVGLLKPGYGSIDLIATADTPPGPPCAALLGWIAQPDAEWQQWRRPEVVTAASDPELATLDSDALIIPLGDATLYGVLAVQDGALTRGEIVLAAGLLAARLDRLAAERDWRASTAKLTQDSDSTLAALNELGRALASGIEGDTLWTTLHEQLQLLFDVTSFFVGLYDRDSDSLALPLISEDGILTPGDTIPLCGLSRAVIAHGIELHFRDLEAEADRLAALGIQPDPREPGSYALSWMGVPLRGRNHDVIGIIALQNVVPASFDDGSLALLTSVAQQVALALDNIRLAMLERERRTIVTALTEMGQIVSSSPDYDDALDHMLAQLQRITQYDSANILLAPHLEASGPYRLLLYAFNSPELFLKGTEIFIPETHPIGVAIAARQPVQIDDVTAHPGWDVSLPLPDARQTRALLVMPMIVYNRVAGVITLVRFTPVPFTEVQASSALALARQSAMALETARLRAQYQASYELQVARARRL
ncbi:MAG: GAF domain-containing protein, partial [Anaerolinea sp.]|nr:GAF domain-containing protein [Anaerolinea sp.]